jgi:Ca2+-binding RTX toxin-like protein
MTDNAVGGNDNLTFTATADAQVGGGRLSGDSGTSMSDNTQGGDDILTAIVNGEPAALSASLVGDAPTMSGSAHGGNDTLNGASTPDRLWGDAMSYAPSAPGSITGGTDVLNGGGGNDNLWGGPNNDTFVFNAGSGADVIQDFDQGNLAVGSTALEHDVIDVAAYGFTDWTTLSSLISDNSSGDAVIHLSANDTITLNGVRTADLNATDFIV